MAKLPIDIHLEAHSEEREAFQWYRERSAAAAEAFLDEVESARLAIQRLPDAWAEYLYGTRYYQLKRFPYMVVYRVMKHRIEILAIAHGRREPGYWAGRL